MFPILVDNIPLIMFTLGDGHLFLTVRIFDRFNNLILLIEENTLTYKIDTWDIQLVGRRLVLREAERTILVDMSFEVPNRISINRGRLLCNGVVLELSPEKIVVNERDHIYENIVIGCQGGLLIGNNDPRIRGFCSLQNVSRYPA